MPTSQGSSTAQANPRKRPRKQRGRSSHQRSTSADLPLDLIPGYDPRNGAEAFWFDEDAARRAIDFFSECLTFTAGQWRGEPFILQPWQSAVTANLFGWKRHDGLRRYREAFILCARKSGKSEWAGGLGCLLTFADGEPGAQVYCAAADREQARLVFTAAKTMVAAEPELARRGNTYTNSIVVEETGSTFKVVSAEAYSKHGINAHGIIIDELHAHENRELVDVLITSTGARRQPLVVMITTADYARESICNEKYEYACKVRDGIIDDPAFLPVIYEAPPDADWTDPEVWALANPNMGISISKEYLERECRRAQESPAYENTFKRLHLNIRTEQDVRWLPMDAWDHCGELPIQLTALKNQKCFAGLDLASTTDITALVLAFLDKSGEVTLIPKFWLPLNTAKKRERKDRVPYTTWARQGLIELTDGDVVDYDRIRIHINELKKTYRIKEIALDPWNATQLSVQLQGDGFEVVTFGQGFRDMTSPTKELEKLVISGKLRHGGHAVMRWMASNVSVELDAAGNIKPSRKKSIEKIDGIVAAIMALGRALAEPQRPQARIYLL